MEEVCEKRGVNLKSIILGQMKNDDLDTYSKITWLKNHIQLDELLADRYSFSFLFDLYFFTENGSANIDSIMHEVRFLEGKG